MDTPFPAGVNVGNKNTKDRIPCHPYPKHCHKIYYDKANYGPMSSSGAVSGGAVFKLVVGEGEPQSGDDMRGGTGGRDGKGLRGAGRGGDIMKVRY